MKRALLAIAMLALIASACADSVTAGGPGAGPQIVVRLTAGQQGASGELTFANVGQSPNIGSNCWSSTQGSGGVARCVDAIRDIVVPKDHVAVPRGVTLRVEGDATKFSAKVATVVKEGDAPRLDVVQELTFTGGKATIDVPPGDYTLEVDGSWPQGQVPFYFGISVT